ncbi:hypothetical protein M758_3G189700 [Ceratodon purpureus]|nr:hypothetical protein M758_3G189700 [Ceratodon purpureus]
MAAWNQLQKFRKKRDPSKHAEMEATFLSIWSQADLFCSADSRRPRWHPTPHQDYLPRLLANRFSSARIFRSNPTSTLASSSESESSSPPIDSPLAPMTLPRVIEEVEDLVEAIIGQLIGDIQAEVDDEDEDLPNPAHSDQLSLPDDVLSLRFLANQNSIWSPFS